MHNYVLCVSVVRCMNKKILKFMSFYMSIFFVNLVHQVEDWKKIKRSEIFTLSFTEPAVN